MKNKTIFSVVTAILLFVILIMSMTMVMSCDEEIDTDTSTNASEDYNNDDSNNNGDSNTNTHTHTIATTSAIEATCTTAGKTEGKYCETCGVIIIAQTEIAPKSHDYDIDWTVDKEATCKETGIKSLHCKNCNDKINITEIPLGEHAWDNGVITKKATCTALGSKTCTCNVCGKTKEVTLSKKEHILNKNRVCSMCDELIHYDITLTETERALAKTWKTFSAAEMLNETEDYYEFYVAYLNTMGECLKIPMSATIILTNDDGTVFYKGVKYISTNDYANVNGALRAVVKIYKNEMTAQNFKCGKLIYTTKVGDVVSSYERTININGISWILPAVPSSYSEYNYKGTKVATIKITNITWEYSHQNYTSTYIYLDCEMTYSNTSASQRTYISYKIEDASGRIIVSDSRLTESMVVGETCKVRIYVSSDDLARGETYTLKLMNTV